MHCLMLGMQPLITFYNDIMTFYNKCITMSIIDEQLHSLVALLSSICPLSRPSSRSCNVLIINDLHNIVKCYIDALVRSSGGGR